MCSYSGVLRMQGIIPLSRCSKEKDMDYRFLGNDNFFIPARALPPGGGGDFIIKVREIFIRCNHQGFASNMRLNGVSVALLNLLKPPLVTTSLRRPSPACAPSARPTS